MRINQIIAERIINISKVKNISAIKKAQTNSLATDIFEASKGILEIRNLRSGDYGAICDGSKPLRPFFETFDDLTAKEIRQIGISTNMERKAPAYLKSKANKPLSTSEVHDCAVAYFYNKLEQTHFLFHIPPQMENSSIKKAIEIFMPEGFEKAIIVPGDNYWTTIHKESVPKIFETIRDMAPETKIEVFHNSSRLPEIVGYNGSVYEIRNTRHILNYSRGQASFKISDIRNSNTLDDIKELDDIFALKILRGVFNLEDYDPEVKKVLIRLIDEKISKLSGSKK